MSSYSIEKIQIKNFRNLSDDIISFAPKINCIFGENGNGKTNILEAIYVLTTRKSFRKNTSFPQFLSVDGEKPEIIFSSAFSDIHKKQFSYSARLNHGRSEYFIDGKPVKKKIDFKLVFINPFDSYGFMNIPSVRRNWFDLYCSQFLPGYKKLLSKYQNSLRFRNTLLSKKPSKYRDQIFAIDKELASCCVELTNHRIHFIKELSPLCGDIFREIFSQDHKIELLLETRFKDFDAKMVFNYMQKRLDKDKMAGFTTYCVHKDDYNLLFDGMNAFEFCSLGQQKISYLSLLFAYIRLFGYKYMSSPIVLIDDVSGELDQLRWSNLIEYLGRGNFQVLITTANEKFKEELEKIDNANRIYVEAGRIRQNP